MIFTGTKIPGAAIVDIEPHGDERGFFARTFCRDEFMANGIDFNVVQCNTSFNHHKGTLRGMHFQAAPHGEPKLVRCVRGKIFDVAVDLRPTSPNYCEWIGVELSAENGRALYLPEGVAHGFVTLRDKTEVFYQMGASFVPGMARGVRWNDPAFGVKWPVVPEVMSERDAQYPDFVPDLGPESVD